MGEGDKVSLPFIIFNGLPLFPPLSAQSAKELLNEKEKGSSSIANGTAKWAQRKKKLLGE